MVATRDTNAISILGFALLLFVGGHQRLAAGQESAGAAFGLMYWTNRDEGVYRGARDGSEIKLLVDTKNADGVAIDLDNRKLYWTERGKLCQANLDGSDVEPLVVGKTSQYSSIIILPPEE